MGSFIAAGLIVQTLYLLIDLYFVARLGKEAVAGVAAAGSSTFITMSIAQLVGAGSLSLISRAIGRKDKLDAQMVFEQAVSLGLSIALVFLIAGYSMGPWVLRRIASSPNTAEFARLYLFAFLPSLAAMFPGAAMGSSLRASGIVVAPMAIQSATVLLNVVLAPIFIMGWGTHHPLGVVGAGLASSVGSISGVIIMAALFNRLQTHTRLGAPLHPNFAVWRRIAAIGLPATGEFAMIFVTTTVTYWSIQKFGPQAQAGYGIGTRIMQAIFLPAMAVALATGPIAGQSFGAKNAQRVRDTFLQASVIGVLIMVALTLLCHVNPGFLVAPFSSDSTVIIAATQFLKISSWNFVAVGLSLCCSGMFQALGDTRPALISSSSRLVTYVVPAIWISVQPWAKLQDFWYLSVASISAQAALSFLILRSQLHHKLHLFASS